MTAAVGLIANAIKSVSTTFIVLCAVKTCPAQSIIEDDVQKAARRIAAKLAVEIRIARQPFRSNIETWSIHGAQTNASRLALFLPLFESEVMLLPKTFFSLFKLRTVVLCESLRFDDEDASGCAEFHQRAIYLDIGAGLENKEFKRKGIHHELFHLFDFYADRNASDQRWRSLNRNSFRYGSSAAFVRHWDSGGVSDRYPGFLNHYSTTAVSEDKAEVFANMIVEPALVETLSSKDSVLKAKAELMTELMRNRCPEMNDGCNRSPLRNWRS